MVNPKLRFKADDGTEFPEWGSTTLNKQGVFIRGLSYKKQNVVDDHTKTLVLRSSNILQFGKLDCLNKCQFVNKQPLPNQILQKGDIVICMANGSAHLVGKASCYEGGYQTGNLTVGAFCSIYRQHTFPIAKYIFQTQSYLNFISENSQGGNGAISNIKPSTYEDFECSYPCLEEQRKIADFLSTFDDKVEAKEQQLEALQETKKGLLQQIFSQQLRFKADDGTEFPDWRKTSIAKIAKVIGGGTPSTKNPEYWDGDVLWFTPSEINSKYLSTSQKCITDLGVKKSSAKVLPKNTLLLTTRASLGLCSINNLDQLVSTNQGFQSLVCNECVNHEFLYYCISTKSFQNEMLRLSSGSTFKEISSTALKSINVCVPCFEEQRKIAEFLSAFDEKIEAVKRQLEALREIKKGLLQQMFV